MILRNKNKNDIFVKILINILYFPQNVISR